MTTTHETSDRTPTERELEILKVLWELGEGTVRQVWETLQDRLPIVQNTVQAFLRTMEDKGLVTHRTEGRSFVYRPADSRERTEKRLVGGLLERAFDGAIDQLVASALSVRRPKPDEIARLKELIAAHEEEKARQAAKPRGRRETKR